MNLKHLGPVSCISPSWIPLESLLGVAAVAEGLAAGHLFVSILNF